jgi:hypothetical protein
VLFLFLAGTMVSGGVTPPPVVLVPSGGGGGGLGSSGASHHELPEKSKQLIDRLLKEEVSVVLEHKPDGTVTASSPDFTDEELSMIVLLLSEI